METWLQGPDGSEHWTRVAGFDARRLQPVVECQDTLIPLAGDHACHDGSSLSYAAKYANYYIDGRAPDSCLNVKAWVFGSTKRISAISSGLSHAKAVAIAYSMGLEEALFLEDDVRPFPLMPTEAANESCVGIEGVCEIVGRGNSNESTIWGILRGIIDSLPSDWTVLQTTSISTTPDIAGIAKLQSERVLWSRRDQCFDTTFGLFGVQAYVLSRRGMEAILTRHFPSLLYATLEEAQEFCGDFDLRVSSTSVMFDNIAFVQRGTAFRTHIPLFIPDADIGDKSTVWLADDGGKPQPGTGVVMTSATTTAALESIALLREDGILRAGGGGWPLEAAIRATQLAHGRDNVDWNRRQRAPIRYVLIPRLDIDVNHHRDQEWGVPVGIDAVEVTTKEQRWAFIEDLREKDVWTSRLWTTLLDVYFHACGAVDETDIDHSLPPELYVLIVLDYGIRAMVGPYPRGVEDELHKAKDAAETFCKNLRHSTASSESCVHALFSCWQWAAAVL